MLLLLVLGACADSPGGTSAFPNSASNSDQKKETILLQALGEVPGKHLEAVEQALVEYYNVEVERRPQPIPLPKSAWYAPRQRYRADSLIRFLRDSLHGQYDRVIGLTAKDISTTKPPHEDWGIMGLAFMPGKACVVSTYRIKRGADEKQFYTRLKRVAKHEFGHSLGLPHCDQPKCFMRDAEGKVSTVDEEGNALCERCRGWVSRYVRNE